MDAGRPLDDRLRSSRSDIVDESCKKRVENVRRFPERRVLHAGKAMAPPAPQIRIFRNVEIIEVDKRIFGTIHDSQRDRTILDEPALIYPDTRTCGLKNRLSCEAIRSLT